MNFDTTGRFAAIAAGLIWIGIGAADARTREACEQIATPSCQAISSVRPDNVGRFRLAQILPFDCVDRCIADFKTCLGVPPRRDPPVILPPPGSGNNVPTPPPFEQCLAAQDQCIAACKAAANTR